MDAILISQARLDELKKQLKELKASLAKDNDEGVKMGGPLDSYKEAAAFQVILGAKREKINEIDAIIRQAEILPEKIPGNTIIIGKWFEVDNGQSQISYRLVHPVEADPTQNKISPDAPLGKAVLGQKKGYAFSLNNRSFKIISVA